MNDKQVFLTETATGKPVPAVFHPTLPAAIMRATEGVWAPHRRLATDTAEHAHWNWYRKSLMLANPDVRCLGIETGGEMQGLLLLLESGRFARCEPDFGQPLLYVEFLEAAPWNTRAVSPVPRYRQVGRRLMVAAVELSSELGYDGRVGLHSLPQSEPFYEHGCGMRALGRDYEYDGLMYYEYPAELAADFRRRSDGE